LADPTYLTGDEVNRAYEAQINGKAYTISSATISVWNPAGTKIINGVSMTIAGTRATYQISGANTGTAGTYTVEVDVTFANSQGQLSFSETFVVTARMA